MQHFPKNQLTEEYKGHQVFHDIDAYIDFYDSLSDCIFSFVSSGVSPIGNLDSYIVSSIIGTLDSIRMTLAAGRINDAYALVRKFHDCIVINAYEISYLENECDLDKWIVAKIENWIRGKEKLPSYAIMMEYLKKTTKLSALFLLLEKDARYKELRSRCNDHTHYNLFYYAVINDNQIFSNERVKLLDQLSEDLKNLVILHLGFLFTLKPHYMSSSDYIDSLEMELEPEEGSQYFVAPFIQNFLDEIIKPNRMDIADLIKSDSGMYLE
jgi:hypothetical protein